MRRETKMAYVSTERETLPVISTNKHWLKPRSFWHRWLIALLQWADVLPFAIDETVTFHRIPIDGDVTVEKLWRMCDDQHYNAWDAGHGTTLLIGSEDYARLMQCPDIRSALMFKVSDVARSRDQIFGLDVVVAPYISGFVVLPYRLS